MKISKILLPMLLSGSLSLTACTANDINAGIGVAGNLFKSFTITNEQLASEARLSAKAMDADMKAKKQLASSKSKYSKRLNRLTKNLKNYDGLNLDYKVYLSKEVNAFAMPDGTVRVYSGLMDKMSDDELLSVIGHEIGHVKKQHSLNQYKKIYLAKAAKEGLTAYGNSTTSALAGSYGNIGILAIKAQFSQQDELASDNYGVKFLHQLGRNPYAAADAQRKLKALSKGSGGFFSSHPASDKRIKNATAMADKLTKK